MNNSNSGLRSHLYAIPLMLCMSLLWNSSRNTNADELPKFPERETVSISSWTIHIDPEMVKDDSELVKRSLQLLELRLNEIKQVIPKPALEKITGVPLYISRPYQRTVAKAEYHPSAEWLKENGRDPRMAKAVEFTNMEILKDELIRMPWFVLHELAHAYHDQHLSRGFENSAVKEAYLRAKAAGTYDKVERKLGRLRKNVFESSYALTNPMEFFAEATESYFGMNDFAPFDREELEAIDPKTAEMIELTWGVK